MGEAKVLHEWDTDTGRYQVREDGSLWDFPYPTPEGRLGEPAKLSKPTIEGREIARLARRVEELEGAIQNTPCHACNREKIPTLCIGENGCGGFACAGWSDMCCECGYEYAMGQIE